MSIFPAVQSHWQGIKQTVQDDLSGLKQQPLASAGLIGATVLASKAFPKTAGWANLGLLGLFGTQAVREEAKALQTPDEAARQMHFTQAGRHWLNVGLTGLGMRSGIYEIMGKSGQAMAAHKPAFAQLPMLTALVDDGLSKLGIERHKAQDTAPQKVIDWQSGPSVTNRPSDTPAPTLNLQRDQVNTQPFQAFNSVV